MADILDVDALIAGFQRATTTVTLFQRPDLAAQIDKIEKHLTILRGEQATEDGKQADTTLGDQSDITELEEQRDLLTEKLADSAFEITIQALETSEVDKITEKARDTAEPKADEAAKKAREWAKRQAAREGVTDPKEIDDLQREAAADVSRNIVQHEIGVYILAESVTKPQLTVEQARQLADRMGNAQMQKVQRAFYELTSRDPQATLPKSWTPGTTVKGSAHS